MGGVGIPLGGPQIPSGGSPGIIGPPPTPSVGSYTSPTMTTFLPAILLSSPLSYDRRSERCCRPPRLTINLVVLDLWLMTNLSPLPAPANCSITIQKMENCAGR